MPLSEHEQRLLDQIERALYAEDPKFASTVRSTDLRTHMRRRLRRAAVVFAIGFVLLLLGVPLNNLVIGVAGFVVMFIALLMALAAWKRLGSAPSPTTLRSVGEERGSPGATRPRRTGGSSRVRPPSSGGWRHRLEQRWNKRWDERGGERGER
ncbi:MAG TPA: DUF3040 domain-containing protein [Mycobacteriales bacterium]|nr:DUF3040 domain-containing protein [Mycobacteriales bacterium]